MPTTEPEAYKTNIRDNMDEDGPVVALAYVLEWVSGTSVMDLEPIQKSVETTRFRELFSRDGIELEFTTNGYDVTLRSDGDVRIEKA